MATQSLVKNISVGFDEATGLYFLVITNPIRLSKSLTKEELLAVLRGIENFLADIEIDGNDHA